MEKIALPEVIRGEWVWKKSMRADYDSFLFARKEFTLDFGGVQSDLWISAHCAYQLFVNDRFVGFGPLPSNKGISHVDQYDISYYLLTGTNTIAILIYHDRSRGTEAGTAKPPGFWCQMTVDNEVMLWSDKNWLIHAGDCFENCRCRLAPGLDFNDFADMRRFPRFWRAPGFNESFKAADYTANPANFGTELVISPFAANNCEECDFTPVCHGRFESKEMFTHVSFAAILREEEGVYAARCFFFSEQEDAIPVTISVDEPYKFFCNNRLAGACLDIREFQPAPVTLTVREGWNSLLFMLQCGKGSMGFTLLFPDGHKRKLQLMQDTIEDAPPFWNIAGPLKLPLEQATPSLKFERLETKTFIPDLANLCAAAPYLNSCVFTRSETAVKLQLTAGEYVIFKLNSLKYGFPQLECEGKEGDIIDITFGDELRNDRVPPVDAAGNRNTQTVILGTGNCEWLKYIPCECKYLMVSVRKAAAAVTIPRAAFFESYRNQLNESKFECSDRILEKIWDIGKEVFRRHACRTYMDTPGANQFNFLADAYFQAIDGIIIFGDYELSETMLRQFAVSQFENGNIPALSYGRGFYSQINQMFFFPVWLNFHCKASGDGPFLQEMLPHLDLAMEFFESLREEKTGLLSDLKHRFDIAANLTGGMIDERGIATSLNALYCRFLLSSGEIYQMAGRNESAHRCWEVIYDISKELKKFTWDPDKLLFADCFVDGQRSEHAGAYANFLTIYGGIAGAEKFEEVFHQFFNYDPPFSQVPEQTDNPYFNYLLLETVFALSESDWGLRYLKDYWGNRIDEETRAWKPSGIANPLIRVLGQKVSPNAFLIREVVGIRLANPAFATIYFNPAINVIDWAKVVLPTSYGKLRIEWKHVEKDALEVEIFAKFPLKVVPEIPEEVMKNSTFRLGENVVLLDPESNE